MTICGYNMVKARSLSFKSPETTLINKANHYFLRANWYALAISIMTKHDATAACKLMGVYEHKRIKDK